MYIADTREIKVNVWLSGSLDPIKAGPSTPKPSCRDARGLNGGLWDQVSEVPLPNGYNLSPAPVSLLEHQGCLQYRNWEPGAPQKSF